MAGGIIKEKYELGHKIGEGMFGKVKEAVNLEDGKRVAVKIITKAALVGKSTKEVENLQKEVLFMRTLNGHPNVLQLLDLHEDDSSLYLILELAAGGDLFDKIVGDGGFSEETACSFFNQIINGLEYCHSKSIVHRDLKPENLLLGKEDMLKISDFGLSNAITSYDALLKTHCGSEKYAAPEIMGSSDAYRGPPVDIWSAGVILYIMTAGAFPFTEATPRCELFVSLVNNSFQFPEKMSPELKDLLLQMWVIDPSHRITIPQIRQHPWFNLNNALPTPMALSADMDDDLVFQDLSPDMLSHNDMEFDHYEEPVYRSIEEPTAARDCSPIISEQSKKDAANSLSACSVKPTAQFVSQIPESELHSRLSQWFMANGAADVHTEDGDLEVQFKQEEGHRMPLRVVFRFSKLEDATNIAVRRCKGDCVQYIQAYESIIRPAMDACLA